MFRRWLRYPLFIYIGLVILQTLQATSIQVHSLQVLQATIILPVGSYALPSKFRAVSGLKCLLQDCQNPLVADIRTAPFSMARLETVDALLSICSHMPPRPNAPYTSRIKELLLCVHTGASLYSASKCAVALQTLTATHATYSLGSACMIVGVLQRHKNRNTGYYQASSQDMLSWVDTRES